MSRLREYEAIVNQIRRILTSSRTVSFEMVEETAQDYQMAVEEINERLQECEDLLIQGYRSEAIKRSEAEPALHRAVTILDIEDLGGWSECVESFELEIPPPLLVDVAGELQEAYSLEQPLQGLMRLFRLHSLARSPLAVRLKILRQIRTKDANNLIWNEDVRSYEEHRLVEIKSEAREAVKGKQVTTLHRILSELRNPEWMEKPSGKFIQKLEKSHSLLVQEQARNELREIALKLSDAHSHWDLNAARKYLPRWQALLDIAELPSESEPLEIAAPAFEWIAEEQARENEESAYQACIYALEQALDNEAAPRTELEQAVYALERTEREFPESLRLRVSERLSTFQERTTRRNRLIAGGVVLLLVSIGFLTVYLLE